MGDLEQPVGGEGEKCDSLLRGRRLKWVEMEVEERLSAGLWKVTKMLERCCKTDARWSQ